MKDILNKLSSYHLFNNFFPGILFGTFIERLFNISITDENFIFAFFLYYFIGMIISRIGSLVIEPTIKLAIKWKDGTRYVRAEKLDPKIQILLQDLNTYRTITAMGLLAVLAIIVKQTAQTPLGLTSFWIAISASTFITILFAISYYKQTKYITNRINSVLRKDK